MHRRSSAKHIQPAAIKNKNPQERSNAAQKSLRYIPSLDGLRGVGAILVIAAHYGYSSAGWIGVEFFFVLSGFLITSILLTEKNRRFGAYLGRFYWHRLLRTFPAYFGFLLISCLIYAWTRQPNGLPHALPALAGYWYNFY